MVAIIGLIVVIGSVLGGFLMVKGPIGVLVQPSEFVVIGGAAIGGVIVGTPGVLLISLVNKVKGIFLSKPILKSDFLDMMKLLFEIFDIGRREGLLALETHAEEPDKSAIFQKYPAISKSKETINLLCDSMKVLVGGLGPHELEELLDLSVELKEHEAGKFAGILQTLADSLPGLGIVAAVLGIIITMGFMGAGAEVVGHHVAAALVGTFLGVLLSYGIVGPLATNLGIQGELETQLMSCIKHGLVAFAKGNTAAVSVEFARRSVFSDYRPSFKEVEEACKALKGARASQ